MLNVFLFITKHFKIIIAINNNLNVENILNVESVKF